MNPRSIDEFVSIRYPNHAKLYRRLCTTSDKHIAGMLNSLNEGFKKYIASNSKEEFESRLHLSSPDEYVILLASRIEHDLQSLLNVTLRKLFPSLLPRLVGYALKIDKLHQKSKEEQDEILHIMFLAAAHRYLTDPSKGV